MVEHDKLGSGHAVAAFIWESSDDDGLVSDRFHSSSDGFPVLGGKKLGY